VEIVVTPGHCGRGGGIDGDGHEPIYWWKTGGVLMGRTDGVATNDGERRHP